MDKRKLFYVLSFLGLLSFVFAHAVGASESNRPVCPPMGGDVRCHARVVTDAAGSPKAATLPSGYGPQQFLKAYSLTGSATSSGTIVAIVDAYGDSKIKSDLDNYSRTFGIAALPTCIGPVSTSSVACFQKIDQNAGTQYPKDNAGWALETSLDVEVARAVC